MIWGIILIVLGVVFLLQTLGIFASDVWNYVWPLVLIAAGIKLVMRKGGWRRCWCGKPGCPECGPRMKQSERRESKETE